MRLSEKIAYSIPILALAYLLAHVTGWMMWGE